MRTGTPNTARMDRLIHERVHDPYRNKQKPPEPSVCPTCNAVFRDGRWQWAESWPLKSNRILCHACQRTRDNYPAGIITLTGDFALAHKEEILAVARHQEQEEATGHVLHRIMAIEEQATGIVIKTTDLHLPRRIGEAIRRAFKGELDLHYEEEGCFLRVNWSREA